MKIIGITGTIAAGKSTVCEYLTEKYQIPRIDADRVGHEVLTFPDVICQLTEAFGSTILDEQGQVVRKRLGSLVFSDPEKLKKLNAITHPVIIRTIRERIEKLRAEQNAPFLLLEAIELLRTELKDLAEECWVVWAEDEVRRQRVILRDGLSPEEAEKRIQSQWPQENYKRCADVLIDGGAPLEEMYRSLDELYETQITSIELGWKE